MIAVGDKKIGTKFTIQFSPTNPAHIRAAEILNSVSPRGKAQHIANALLCYEIHGESPDTERLRTVDEKLIEDVVKRVLRDLNGAEIFPSGGSENQWLPQAQTVDETAIDDASAVLGEDGFGAVAGALEMFRKK